MEQGAEYLAPHMSSYSLAGPRQMSDSMAMPKPVISTISNWHDSKEVEHDPVKWEQMKMLQMTDV